MIQVRYTKITKDDWRGKKKGLSGTGVKMNWEKEEDRGGADEGGAAAEPDGVRRRRCRRRRSSCGSKRSRR